MIIESITAFTAIKVIWETLEIFHQGHVAHETFRASYKGLSAMTHALQEKRQAWQDKKNPAQQLERDATTSYELLPIEEETQTLNKTKREPQHYITELKTSIKSLKDAEKKFSKLYKSLQALVKALNRKDNEQFLLKLLEFKSNLELFRHHFKQFSLTIKLPPRQALYISDTLAQTNFIEQYNEQLKTLKTTFMLLKDKQHAMSRQFNEGANTVLSALSMMDESDFFLPQHVQQSMEKCLYDVTQLAETMHRLLPKNDRLAITCSDIIQLSTDFMEHRDRSEQGDPWEENPAWFPLLTEAEQIETGQRIFLHMMNETTHSEEKKLKLAQVLLRKHISSYEINQIEIELLSYEMACTLRTWQIDHCQQLIQCLGSLTLGAALPTEVPNGLLEWLKTKRKTQSAMALLTELIVLPCCFSQCTLEKALANFKRLSPDEGASLIQHHFESHQASVWQKSDDLIPFPKAFASSILPRARRELDAPSQNVNVVSPVMHRLAIALIIDLKKLKGLFESDLLENLDVQLTLSHKKKEAALSKQKNQFHEAGVSRVKKAELFITAITSPHHSFYPYLYRAETINEAEKKQQVPTRDDLLHLIYKGVNPNDVCLWKACASQPYSASNQLLCYFFPNQDQDTRTKAWLYATTDCQVNAATVFAHLFSQENDRPLALGNTPQTQAMLKNSLSMQAILKNPQKIASVAAHSKALSNVTKKIAKDTESVFEKLQNYCVMAIVRMKPEYRKELPLKKQLECLVKNLFKFGQEIGEERLESVQIYLGDLCTVLSAEDIKTINEASDDLKKNYESRALQAKKVETSTLHKIMKNALDKGGPLSTIIEQNQEVYKATELNSEKERQWEERERNLQKTIQQLELEKKRLLENQQASVKELSEQLSKQEVLESRLEKIQAESEAKLEKIQAESEVKLEKIQTERMQDKAELEKVRAESEAKLKELQANMNKMMGFFNTLPQATNQSSAPDANGADSTNLGFFKR